MACPPHHCSVLVPVCRPAACRTNAFPTCCWRCCGHPRCAGCRQPAQLRPALSSKQACTDGDLAVVAERSNSGLPPKDELVQLISTISALCRLPTPNRFVLPHCLQANAVPTIFWVLGLLLLPENKQHLEAVVAEAQQAAGLGGTAAGSPAAGGTAAAAVQGTPAAAAKARARSRASGTAAPPDASQPASHVWEQPEEQQAAGQLLTQEQQQGLVDLACNRHSHIAAAISETLRLRCFRCAPQVANSLFVYRQRTWCMVDAKGLTARFA